MIKLIIFDLDGVLVETKKLHFDALNRALKEVDSKYIITIEEHLSKYDGLNTHKKLNFLSKEKGLPLTEHSNIWLKKQLYTLQMVIN
jgi:beta-phosphoglucomutase-like phosphatase (HAD superfamily)